MAELCYANWERLFNSQELFNKWNDTKIWSDFLIMKGVGSGAFIGVGIALGVAFGAAFDNVGIGIVFGIVVGSAIDWFRNSKSK